MDLKARILQLLKEKKDVSSILLVVAEEYKDVEAVELAKTVEVVQKAYSAEVAINNDAKEIEAKKLLSSEAEKLAKKMLESMPVDSLVDKMKASGIQLKEGPSAWIVEQADMVKAIAKRDVAKAEEISNRMKLRAENMGYKGTAIRTDSDAAGGYAVAPEMDMLVDSLLYKKSALLEKVKEQITGEKTLIVELGALTAMTPRTNQNTDYGTQVPTWGQTELAFKDYGTIVPVANASINGSAINVVNSVAELFADIEVKTLETLILTGVSATNGFNGAWFYTGISSIDALLKDGTGAICAADLDAIAKKAAVQSASENRFLVMPQRAVLTLLSETTDDGHLLNRVVRDGGKVIDKITGLEIVESNASTQTLGETGITGTWLPVVLFNADRFRFYVDGPRKISTSDQLYFASSQLAIKLEKRMKQIIPAHSLTSFVRLTGVSNGAE